jgi:hypothetical protein
MRSQEWVMRSDVIGVLETVFFAYMAVTFWKMGNRLMAVLLLICAGTMMAALFLPLRDCLPDDVRRVWQGKVRALGFDVFQLFDPPPQ